MDADTVAGDSAYGREYRLAKQLAAASTDPYDLVQKVMARVNRGARYTEAPPAPGRLAPLDAFLFRDHAGYIDRVLHAVPLPPTPHLPFTIEAATSASLAYGLAALVLALALAAFGLWYRRLPRGALAAARVVLAPPGRALHAVHSGIVGDYLLWLCAGTALLGGLWALALR